MPTTFELAHGECVRFTEVSKRYRLGSGRGAWEGDLRDEFSGWMRRWWSQTHRSVPEDTVVAVDRVSIRIRQGENVGVIGPNGAGKTTLLRLISRITRPSEGEVLVRGRVASMIQIGAGFHRELTGKENVYLYGAILGVTRAEIHACYDSIVAFAGLPRFMDTPVKRYSDGMLVRLGFAVAVHVDPDILLIDEVLAVGDNEFREKCLQRMGEYARGDTTVILTTHHRAIMERVCERALYFDSGGLVLDGELNEVWDHYERRMGPGI